MSRESKIFSVPKMQISNKVRDYEAFGWELLSINGIDVSMSRETQNDVYIDLVKYEHQYEMLVEKRSNIVFPKKPAPFDIGLMLILILLFVLPSILYVLILVSQNKKYKEEFEYARREHIELTEQIAKTCEDSRATFFAKQR